MNDLNLITAQLEDAEVEASENFDAEALEDFDVEVLEEKLEMLVLWSF